MTDIDNLALEAAESPEDRTDLTQATLCGEVLDVLPSIEWRTNGISALNRGDFDGWAIDCLTEESWEKWKQLDPTVGEVDDFFASYKQAARESLGESSASRRSSRRTARR